MRGVFLARFAARAAGVLWLGALGLSLPLTIAGAQEPVPVPAPDTVTTPAPERGTVSGRVLDRDTGQPLPSVNVIIVGTRMGTQTDLDGRFRFGVPAGPHSVRAMRIGFAMSQVDSVRVRAGANTAVNFSLGAASVTLQTVEVEGRTVRANSEDALLATQKTAARISDGISAEAISRAPGSDAADAIVRVTGVSVLDDKFVVVRGLAERYSNTLLNGVELTSPEPLKKIVPLDLFPASLIESIITSKTALPDRPGDFAGGSVEITTKDFPDEPTAQLSMSLGYNSEGTFRNVPQLEQRGTDYLGFDDGSRRSMPPNPPTDATSPDAERFAEAMRNVWTPPPTRVSPDLSLGANVGGRVGSENSPIGYVFALSYSRKTDYTPDRLNQLVFNSVTGEADRGYVARETTHGVDVGGIANLAFRLGQSTKLGWKNLYTRSAEEVLSQNIGFETYNGPVERRIYQTRYVTRELRQTQLTGDHLLGFLWSSRLEWKGTMSAAARDEPENRSLIYFKNSETGVFAQGPSNPSPMWFRFLEDQLRAGQLDWSIPLGFRRSADAMLKFGWSYRTRDRSFDAYAYRIGVKGGFTEEPEPARLPPEQALAPENIGPVFELQPLATAALPYESDDDLRAGYVMLDLPVFSRLRVIGGARLEDWELTLYPGTRDAPLSEPTRRRNRDVLWSGNMTLKLTDRQNLRFAGYRTVARPDPREVSPDYYAQVTGDCGYRGNPNIQRSRILNGDIRWEMYPGPGELFSVSGFYKKFENPIVERVLSPGSASCEILFDNVKEAQNFGVELEVRRDLGFLPGPLSRISAGLNVTVVESRADYYPTEETLVRLPLQGQSDFLGNVNLRYADPDRGFEASLLLNTFSDRTVRYGSVLIVGTEAIPIPNVLERGRTTLDAKIQRRLGSKLSISLSGRNLTDAETLFVQDSEAGVVRTGYSRPGITVGLGMGYAIR